MALDGFLIALNGFLRHSMGDPEYEAEVKAG